MRASHLVGKLFETFSSEIVRMISCATSPSARVPDFRGHPETRAHENLSPPRSERLGEPGRA
jgi:hypothetical protein